MISGRSAGRSRKTGVKRTGESRRIARRVVPETPLKGELRRVVAGGRWDVRRKLPRVGGMFRRWVSFTGRVARRGRSRNKGDVEYASATPDLDIGRTARWLCPR